MAQPVNLAAMSDLLSGVQSQTQETLQLPGGFEIVFLKKPHKWVDELRNENKYNEKAATWNNAAQELPTGEQI